MLLRKLFLIVLLGIVSPNLFAQISFNIDLLSQWKDPVATFYNEVWGFVENGREYAVLGSYKGTHIFDVTDPANPVKVDYIPGADSVCTHRDYHDYNGYLYMVADEGTSTLQILDLSFLPDSAPVVFDSDTFFTRSHNIFIDSSNGKMYSCGGDNNNGLRVFSLANPVEPFEMVNFSTPTGYVHDVYVRNDTAYANCANQGLYIYDFSNVLIPKLIGSLTAYPHQGYNHAGWLNSDGSVYVMADETVNKDVKILDVSDLGNITVIDTVNSGADTATDPIAHNVIILGNYAYVSYYQDGLFIYNISDPANTAVSGYYDTNTLNISSYGDWGVYPLLPSGILLASDMANGLFIFDPTNAITSISDSSPVIKEIINAYPNPFTDQITITVSKNLLNGEYRVVDLAGKIVDSGKVQSDMTINTTTLPQGNYIVEIQTENNTYISKAIKVSRK